MREHIGVQRVCHFVTCAYNLIDRTFTFDTDTTKNMGLKHVGRQREKVVLCYAIQRTVWGMIWMWVRVSTSLGVKRVRQA